MFDRALLYQLVANLWWSIVLVVVAPSLCEIVVSPVVRHWVYVPLLVTGTILSFRRVDNMAGVLCGCVGWETPRWRRNG